MSSTFGKVYESKTYNQYYDIKNERSMCCSPKNMYLNSEGNLLMRNKLILLKSQIYSHIVPFNKANLVSGLYTEENLKYARTIADVSNNNTYTNIIDPLSITVPFYSQYVIDPSGSLFGKTSCGINNYLHYVQFCKTN